MDEHRPEDRRPDRHLETVVGNLLRGGVLTAAAVVAIGGLLYLLGHGADLPAYHAFQGEPSDLRSVSGIVTDALELRSRGIIQLGLLLLIATPVMRVAVAGVAFAQERDRIYVLVALIVLGLLSYSLCGGQIL